MKWILPSAERWKTDVGRIAAWLPWTEMSHDDYDADNEIHDSSDVGNAEGKLLIRLKQTEFSLKQITKWMG